MGKDINKKMVIPFITFLGFIAISVSSLLKGIEHHETWRIVLAATGGLFFAGFAGLLIHTFIKNRKTTARI